MMAKNMSGFDRTLRLFVGLFLVVFAITGKAAGWAGILGLVLLATAIVSRCPLYALLGFKVK